MLSGLVKELASPDLVARFQRLCGVEQVSVTDQQSPTANGVLNRSPGTAYNSGNNHSVTRRLQPSSSSSSLQLLDQRNFASESADDSRGDNNNSVYPHAFTNGTPFKSGCSQVNGISSQYAGKLDKVLLYAGHCYAVSQNGVEANHVGSVARSLPDSDHDPHNNTEPVPGGTPPAHIGVVEGSRGPADSRVVIRYPLLYYWARVGACLGNEEFYLTVLPFLLWTVDGAMMRQVAVLWWAVMYVGQATKDYLGWPRPPSPPVVRLETAHLAEFTMPSTHAMAGTAIPLLLSTLLLQRYQMPVVAVVSVASVWCATTCLSRLYLGVHTVLDVVVGVLLSLALFLLLSPLIPAYDLHQQTHPLAPLAILPASLALCTVCYPAGSGKTSAKGDAIIITAVLVGVSLGSWLNFQLGLSQPVARVLPMPATLPTISWLGSALLQFLLGVAVVFALKAVLKPLTVRIFCAVYGLGRVDCQHPGVMVGYRYTTYLCLGLAIAFLDPLLFATLGFGRPGYYHDVV